jgi:hypothetical protein
MDAGGRMQLANHNINKKPKTQGKTQIPQPDLRLTFERQQSKQRKGHEPNKKQPQKICQRHSGKTHCVTMNSKSCSKRINVHPEK